MQPIYMSPERTGLVTEPVLEGMAAAGKGKTLAQFDIAPFVRVPANTAENIQRALDGGALGVIAPNVRSAEEARAVVAAVKYPPKLASTFGIVLITRAL